MVDITEQIVREAPEIEAYKLGLLKSAKALADQGVTLPAQQVAGMSGLQTAAIDQATAGIGGYQPYLQEAGYTMGDAQGQIGGVPGQAAQYQARSGEVLESALSGIGGAMQGFDPSTAAAFMNPYEQAAVQQAMADVQRSGDIQQQQLNAQAVGAGAFGGSRQGIQQAELDRNILETQARTAAQMRQAGYEGAAGRAQQAFEQQQGRALQGGQIIGQLGQGIGALGTDYGQLGLAAGEGLSQLGLRQASLGQTVQGLGQQETGFLFDLGKQQQAQQQAELEAQRQTELSQAYEPYQRVSFLSDIYKGAPSTQQTIAASTSPSVSPAQTILGLGIGGLSAAAGAQRAGLFG